MKGPVRIPVIVLLGFTLFFYACNDLRVVARVGNHVISTSDFLESFLDDKSEAQAKQLSFQTRLDHLNRMIDEELKFIEARQMNLDEDESIRKALKAHEERLVFQAVVDRDLIDRVVTESMIKKEYRKRTREVKLRHIFFPKKRNATDEEKKSLMARLDSLRNVLRHGADFDRLARKFSKDSLSAGKGGDLGFVKWGDYRYGDQFYEKVFGMRAGSLAGPIESKAGYHLVWVERFRKADIPPLRLQRFRIRNELLRKKQRELDDLSQKVLQRIERYFSLKFDDENMTFLLKKLDEGKEGDQGSQEKAKGRFLGDLSAQDRDRVLASYDGGSFTLGQFADLIGKMPPFRRPRLQSYDQVKRFIENQLARPLVVKWGYKQGYHRLPEVKKDMQERKKELMIERVVKLKVDDRLNPTEEELQKYFEEHRENYYEPEKVHVQEIMVKDADLAEKIYQLTRTNSFDALAEKYNERRTTKGRKGDLGFITAKQYGQVGKQAMQMKIGEISKPIKNGLQFSIIKILGKRPRTPKSFEEVKGRVKSDYKRKKRKEIFDQWLADLRSRIPVYIYEANLKKAL